MRSQQLDKGAGACGRVGFTQIGRPHAAGSVSTGTAAKHRGLGQTKRNPYLDYMAAADAFVIAKDPITMPCELWPRASRSTHGFDPRRGAAAGEGSSAITRDLHETLQLTGRLRGRIEPYSYEPLG